METQPLEAALAKELPLAQEQIDDFRTDGHVVVRDLVPAEVVAAVRPLIRDHVAEATADAPSLEQRDTYGKAFLQVSDVHRTNAEVRKFVCARRFAKVAAELMGVPAIRLYFDQALFKEPGGGFTPWHNDHTYWPIATENMITLWLPLVDISTEVGSLEFVSGSHRAEHRDLIVISDRSEDRYARLVEEQGLRVETHGALRVGDATFHSGWTLHRAPGNPGQTTREVIAIAYFEDGARLVEDVPPSQRGDLAHYFGDLHPGDVAASDWTPVVYSEV